MFRKIKITDMPDIYTIHAFTIEGQWYIGCGPEKQGKALLLEYPSLREDVISAEPGGMMSVIPVPGEEKSLVSVMGLFPPFKGKDGGIFKHTFSNGSWSVRKVLDLPFAHRCDMLEKNGMSYLFTATVSEDKNDPSDWSKPGQVFMTVLNNSGQSGWTAEPVLDSLFRNHGMIKARINEEDTLCVSGTEGIFAIQINDDGRISTTRIFDKEVSEFAFIDINGDGQDELVTIEPFHGDSLNIYNRDGTGWKRTYDAPLSFGHGLSTGYMKGNPCIAVGNRSGEGSLHIFRPSTTSPAGIERICVEEGTGTTQTQFFHYKETDYILAANQLKSEAVLYELK